MKKKKKVAVEFKHGSVFQRSLQWKQILRGEWKRLFGQAWPLPCWLQVQEVRRLSVLHGSQNKATKASLTESHSLKYAFSWDSCSMVLIKFSLWGFAWQMGHMKKSFWYGYYGSYFKKMQIIDPSQHIHWCLSYKGFIEIEIFLTNSFYLFFTLGHLIIKESQKWDFDVINSHATGPTVRPVNPSSSATSSTVVVKVLVKICVETPILPGDEAPL